MKISQAGIALIKEFEGCELTAYKDIVGVLTIGYGSTGNHVKPGMTITEDDAEELLLDDIARFEDCVTEMVEVDISQSEFDALVSFAFNLGCQALRTSTLLKLLNSGNHEGAAGQFMRWNRANKKEVAGLTRRRQAEKRLFLA